MEMKELRKKYSDAELSELQYEMVCRGNFYASSVICDVIKYYYKMVKVVKGRKVPIGTIGQCFWMGSRNYGKYEDPWGIYSDVRIGIKDSEGEIYWTSLQNVELV